MRTICVGVAVACAAGFLVATARPCRGGQGARAAETKEADPDLKDLAAGNNRFAVEACAKLMEKEEGNLFLSPFSIRTALAMTYAGAREETARQMKKALHFTLDDARLHAAAQRAQQLMHTGAGATHTLLIANSLWGQKGYTFLKPFLDVTATCYGGGLNQVDFTREREAARQEINRWVEERTRDKIKDLVPRGGLDPLTRLVLVNAVYFYGSWERQFDKGLTQDAPFAVTPQKSVTVKMMRHKTRDVKEKPRFRYLETDALQAVELSYKGDQVSMAIFLPRKKDGLPALERELLTPAAGVGLVEQLDKLAASRKQQVHVYLPKWRITWGTRDLTPVLKSLGITEAFLTRKADFSGMNGVKQPDDEALHIAAVFHKAFVDVNEEGTEAAAATAVVMAPTAAPPTPTPVFRADHPFLFLIRQTGTGQILFIGRVAEPAAG
ncbi:MAG TPA: serpin family protein [Planctomycetota bacterium]|nr:serpin family protein [Planctomycetota bacterium]